MKTVLYDYDGIKPISVALSWQTDTETSESTLNDLMTTRSSILAPAVGYIAITRAATLSD